VGHLFQSSVHGLQSPVGGQQSTILQMTFQKKYLLLAVILFIVEILIALFVHDKIVRPYIGDVLVVILIYSFLKIFIKNHKLKIAVSVLIFAFLVELLQYLKLIEILGWENSTLAKTIIGHSASLADLLAYTLGFILILFIERKTISFS
jgi:uncharacterized membrane protein